MAAPYDTDPTAASVPGNREMPPNGAPSAV